MKKVTELTAELAAPFIKAAGCTLWDVEYVREGGTWYLRVYIDCEGGVNIDQCEQVHRPLGDALDEADPIEGELRPGGLLCRVRPGAEKSPGTSPPAWDRRWRCASIAL